MLAPEMMPFLSNSTHSGYNYNHCPIDENYETIQDDEYVLKHGVPFETYVPLDDNCFHRHDRFRENVSFHNEFQSRGTSRYQNMATTFASSKLGLDVNEESVATATVGNVRNEMKLGYFEDLEDNEKDLDVEIEEDVDDDEFLEEEYADAYHAQMTPDSPTRLLRFVKMVTTEIQSRFTRNKGNEDYCDVYEEKFKTTLSGRDLYYADLLAVASNSEAPSMTQRNRSSAKISTVADDGCSNARDCTVIYDHSGNAKSCTLPHEGRQIRRCGLGPLEELFRCNLAWKMPTNAATCSVSYKNGAIIPPQPSLLTFGFGDSNKTNRGDENCGYGMLNVPMTMRKLPSSFWEEPGFRSRDRIILPSVNNTPDFTDLFDQWADK